MQTDETLELEIKKLIIEALLLEDLIPEEISSTDSLFVEGLGLDSIDALEIAMALEQRYGVEVDDDPEANRQRFATVRDLARFVSERRAR